MSERTVVRLAFTLWLLLSIAMAAALWFGMAEANPLRELRLEFKPAIAEFVHAAATGARDELAAFGTRGDGKTWGAAGAIIAHAEEHRAAGFRLPTKWLGVTDTFQSHLDKTMESLLAPGWEGTWTIRDGGRLAEFRFAGVTRVKLRLFGVDSPRDASRVRTECHGVWFEEAAPAQDLSSGISETAWEIGLTSRRLPTHAHVALLTENYPDTDHWTWRRWVTEQRPGTGYVRVPPGERASAADRAKWAAAISDPVLRARLIEGEPGFILLGEQVARGFNAEAHVAASPLPVLRGELWLGWDSAANAHTHATVIGQRHGPAVRIYAGLVTGNAGMEQHLKRTVLPWLKQHAPWVLEDGGDDGLFHRYDPAMDTGEGGDIDQSPLLRVQHDLGGHFAPGAVPWPARIGPVLRLFDSAPSGVTALQIDPGPDTELLRKALMGRWDYAKNAAGTVVRDLPRKPNHPWEDCGDALCYLVGGLAPSREVTVPKARGPRTYGKMLGAI